MRTSTIARKRRSTRTDSVPHVDQADSIVDRIHTLFAAPNYKPPVLPMLIVGLALLGLRRRRGSPGVDRG